MQLPLVVEMFVKTVTTEGIAYFSAEGTTNHVLYQIMNTERS